MRLEFELLAKESEDNLWELFGEQVLAVDQKAGSAGLGARATRHERALAAARDWLERNSPELRKRLCDNERVRSAFASEPGATIDLAIVVADALFGIGGVPIATISMIIARKGLDFICGAT